eukprot:c6871_g1_i1.p1 GENE.c6871_g1_i1~~c6871_g1_i1.p1  ORF type:complete len:411 (+),score=167.02 c6871_g1_i1:109-1341(+)
MSASNDLGATSELNSMLLAQLATVSEEAVFRDQQAKALSVELSQLKDSIHSHHHTAEDALKLEALQHQFATTAELFGFEARAIEEERRILDAIKANTTKIENQFKEEHDANAKLHAIVNELTSKVQHVEEINKGLQAKAAGTERDLEKYKHKFEQSQSEVTSLKEKLADSETTIQGLNAKLTTAHNEHEAAQKQIAKAKADLEAAQKHANEASQKHATEATAKDTESKGAINKLQEQVKTLQTQLDTLTKKSQQDKEASDTALAQTRKSSTTDLEKANGQKDEADKKAKASAAEVEKLKEKTKKLEKDLADATAQNTKDKKELEKLSGQVSAKQSEVSDQNKKAKESEEGWKQKLAEEQAKVEDASKKLKLKELEFAGLEKDVAGSKTQKQGLMAAVVVLLALLVAKQVL